MSKKRGNGEGSIYETTRNGSKVWAGSYTLGYDDNGKRKRKVVYGKTRKEVKDKLDKIIAELTMDIYVDKSSTTLYEIASEIVEDGYKYNKISDSTYHRKLETLKHLDRHPMARKPIQDIKDKDLKDFLYSLTSYSNSIISKVYGLANASFSKAVRKGVLRYNPLDDKLEYAKPKSLKPSKEVHGFTVADHKLILEGIKTRHPKYEYQFLLALYSGCRCGEINALTLKDIDFSEGVIHIRRTVSKDLKDRPILGTTTKTSNGVRDIIIDDQLETILKETLDQYIPNELELVFYNPANKDTGLFTTSQVNLGFKRFCESIGIKENVNQHQLRHTYATRCIEAGVPANVLSKMLGHADITTTLDIYCDVFDAYEKKHKARTYEYLKSTGLEYV